MSTPTLSYANPAVFFHGVYRHRSSGPLVGVVAFAAFGLGLGWIAFDRPMDLRLRIPLFGLAAALLLGAGYLTFNALRDRVDTVRITEDGIEDGRRLWPWARIASLAGVLTRNVGSRADGVTIEFTVGRGGLKFPRPLLTTPDLTPEQFDRLVAVLDTYLARHHPHVEVDPHPRVPSG